MGGGLLDALPVQHVCPAPSLPFSTMESMQAEKDGMMKPSPVVVPCSGDYSPPPIVFK